MMAATAPGRLLRREAWWVFARYYRPRAWPLLWYALAAALQSLFVLPVLLLIRLVFDAAIPQGRVDWLPWIGGGIVLIRVAQSVVGLWLRGIVLDLVKGALAQLREDLIDRLFVLSRAHLNHADLDQVHTRIVLDSERFEQLSSRLLSSMLPAAFASLALLAIAAALNWQLVTLTATVLPVLLLTSRRAGRRVQADVQQCQQAMEEFSKGARFALHQQDLIRLTASEEGVRATQHGLIRRLSERSRRMAMSFAVTGQVQRNLSGLAGILILVAGAAAVAEGGMTLGDLMSFYVAAGLLNGQLDQLVAGTPEVIAGQAALVKLHDLLTEGETRPYRGTRRIAFGGEIRLDDLHFGYDDHRVLAGVDLRLPPGARVAIVGANGVGKTTLLNLVVGFCRPTQGALSADGIAYDDLDLADLRRQIGVVMQQPALFAGSVLENLRFGRPEADLESVRAAARRALADGFIRALPQGYDTPIGDGGVLLSGGERQRLAIARALLGAPRLLILDEPTNHLDSAAVGQLLDSLRAAPGHPTLLIVSHDPAVVARADTVRRLADGRLQAFDLPAPEC